MPPYYINVNSTGNDYTFHVGQKQTEEGAEIKEIEGTWSLEILNSDTGMTVYKRNIDDSTVTINTSGWKSGCYIIAANVGGRIVTKKLAIK